MHDAIELAVFTLPTSGERNENTTSIGEMTNWGTSGISCVDQGAIERDASGAGVDHQQVRLACLNCRTVVCQSNNQALLYWDNGIEAVI